MLAQSLSHATRRSISNKASVVRRNVLRKYKRGIDRLPSQGADPSAQFKHGWRLASAAVIERYPVITPEVSDFESDYLLGRFLEQQRCARPVSARLFMSEKDVQQGRSEPDMSDAHADMYEPAGRVTQADRDGDMQSMQRALDERLYFVIRRNAQSKHMQFPQVIATDDAVSMAEYARVAFRSVTTMRSRPKLHMLSHAPACHLQHVFGREYQEKHDVYGLKIFFYRAMVLSGEIDEVRNAEEFVWARESELDALLGEEYFNGVKGILFGVGPRVT